MVDVGYFINGRHGVIRNVSLTANPHSDHRVFTSADCTEQYCMKVNDIEYIIPSDIDNIGSFYTEEKMIELCQKVDPPMTNGEKFKEVFGFKPDADSVESLCEMYRNRCAKFEHCDNCPLNNHCEWNDPYVKIEVEND